MSWLMLDSSFKDPCSYWQLFNNHGGERDIKYYKQIVYHWLDICDASFNRKHDCACCMPSTYSAVYYRCEHHVYITSIVNALFYCYIDRSNRWTLLLCHIDINPNEVFTTRSIKFTQDIYDIIYDILSSSIP